MNQTIIADLQESVMLLIIGMAVVFSFLSILIFAINFIRNVCERYFPEVSESTTSNQASNITPTTATQSSGISPQVVAAITAAVHQYRHEK